MAKTTILCVAAFLFLTFCIAESRPDYDGPYVWKALEQADAYACTDDMDSCKCIAAKPGRCASDLEVRGACARSCNACDEKKRNLYLGELNKLKRRFVRDFLRPEKRGCSDKFEDCDCMVYMCRQDEIHQK